MKNDSEWRRLVDELRELAEDETGAPVDSALLSEAANHINGLHSWDGLMSILDEVYPADVFRPVNPSTTTDPGLRILSLLRQIHAVRATIGTRR